MPLRFSPQLKLVNTSHLHLLKTLVFPELLQPLSPPLIFRRFRIERIPKAITQKIQAEERQREEKCGTDQ